MPRGSAVRPGQLDRLAEGRHQLVPRAGPHGRRLVPVVDVPVRCGPQRSPSAPRAVIGVPVVLAENQRI